LYVLHLRMKYIRVHFRKSGERKGSGRETTKEGGRKEGDKI